MSTNKTQNYNLHAWTPEDDFQLSEVNANFAALDASVRMLWGTYRGTGDSDTTEIDLGLTPKAVFIFTDYGPLSQTVGASYDIYSGLGFPEYDVHGALILNETGFTAASNSTTHLNAKRNFYYLALY